MSLILDALRKAKALAGGSAPQRAPTFLKSFGFDEQTEQKKSKKILTTYVIPIVLLSSVLAAGVIVYIRWTGASSMQEQAALLDGPAIFLPEADASVALEGEAEYSGLSLDEEGDAENTADDAESSLTDTEFETVLETEPEEVPLPDLPAESTAVQIPPPLPFPEELTLTLDPPLPEETPDARPPAPRIEDSTATEGDELVPEADSVGDAPVETAADETPPSAEVRIRPPQTDPFELALFYHQGGDFLKAMEYYQQLLDANPLDKVVHNNLGLLHMAMANNAEAIRSINTAIRIDPAYGEAHNNLGTALDAEGQIAAAERSV